MGIGGYCRGFSACIMTIMEGLALDRAGWLAGGERSGCARELSRATSPSEWGREGKVKGYVKRIVRCHRPKCVGR